MRMCISLEEEGKDVRRRRKRGKIIMKIFKLHVIRREGRGCGIRRGGRGRCCGSVGIFTIKPPSGKVVPEDGFPPWFEQEVVTENIGSVRCNR